jgi:hypothetical protein
MGSQWPRISKTRAAGVYVDSIIIFVAQHFLRASLPAVGRGETANAQCGIADGAGGTKRKQTRCRAMLYVRRQHDAARPTRGRKGWATNPIKMRLRYERSSRRVSAKRTFEYIFPIFLIAAPPPVLIEWVVVSSDLLRAPHTLILIR